MDGTGRTCLECQAPLAPGTRFCTKCGRPAQSAAPDGTATASLARPGPGSGDGRGFTVVAPSATAPPPAHDRPAPREPQGFESFRSYQPTAPVARPDGGRPPAGPPQEPSQWPPRQPPRRHDRGRSGPPLALWIVLLVTLLGGSAAAGLLIAHPFSRLSVRTAAAPAATGAGTAPASPAPAASRVADASGPAVTERQAASRVATMLRQSVSDRAKVTSAYDDVLACDPAMASAPQAFGAAAGSRQRLITSLAALPGRATLPPALLSDLTRAWQASAAADQAFARWAAGELHGCTPNGTGSAAYQATVTPDDNATRYKTAFVSLWNPIAARYSLAQYQQDQI